MSLKVISFFLGTILFIGCEKFLEVDPPKTQLVPESIFNNESISNAAVISMYSILLNEARFSYRIPLYTGIYSDELTSYSTIPDLKAIYGNAVQPSNYQILTFWTNCYRIIYQCNSILESLRSNNTFDERVRDQLIGEAVFMRGFVYFYLLNMYGSVPLVLTTDYKISSLAGNTDVDSVTKQIRSDLELAASLLSEDFVGLDGKISSGERIRACKYSALALLARVNLYDHDYLGAENVSTQIINKESVFAIDSNLNNISLKNNSEAILQLQTFPGSSNTPDAGFLFLSLRPRTGDVSSSAISSQLLNSFEEGDKRKEAWLRTSFFNGVTYFYPYKYKVGYGMEVSEYPTVFRLAEQYLIRAEARAHLDDISEAKSDVNVIRTRAGLSKTEADTKEDLLKVIMHERQVELFCEWGHRWMDLKRTDALDSIMTVVTPLKGIGTSWENYKKVFPIPQVDRTNNPNLTQNPGYSQ